MKIHIAHVVFGHFTFEGTPTFDYVWVSTLRPGPYPPGDRVSHSQIYRPNKENTIKDSNLTSKLRSSCLSYRIFPFSKYCSDSTMYAWFVTDSHGHCVLGSGSGRLSPSLLTEFKYRTSIPFNRIHQPTRDGGNAPVTARRPHRAHQTHPIFENTWPKGHLLFWHKLIFICSFSDVVI